MAVMDILIKATDQASEVLEKVGGTGNKVAASLDANWIKVGLATAAVGAGMTKLTGRSYELNNGIRSVSAITGESEESLRKMAQSLSTASFSNDDAVASMERLVESGIRTEKQFEKIIPKVDAFGDATGMGAVETIDMFDSALSALGIPLDEVGEHLDTFTFLATQTTVNTTTLAKLMRRAAPDMKSMGLSLNDVAAAMAALEASGEKGPAAVLAFEEAMTAAEWDVGKFYAALGLSEEALATQATRLEESAGLTDNLAEINTRSLGVWGKLKNKIDDAMWSAGTFLEPMRDLGPAMMGIGPAMKGVSKLMSMNLGPAFAGAAKSVLLFGKALLMNPMTWIVLGIVALVAAIYLLWKNWDKVSAFLVKSWEWVKEKAGELITGIVEWFKELPGKIWTWLTETVEKMKTWASDMKEKAAEAAKGIWDGIVDYLKDLPGRLLELGQEAVGKLAEGIRNSVGGALGSAVDKAKGLLNRLNPFARSSPSLVDYFHMGMREIEKGAKNLDIPKFDLRSEAYPPEFSAGGSGRAKEQSRVVEHRHSGVLKVAIEGGSDAGTVNRVMEIVIDEIRREVRRK